MSRSRREFLLSSTGVLLAASAAAEQKPVEPPAPAHPVSPASAGSVAPHAGAPAPGTPPAFGTARPVGPEVTAATFVEAEKLVQVELTPRERAQAAENWRSSMAALYERRTGPRKVALDAELPPYSTWNPLLPGMLVSARPQHFSRSSREPGPLPRSDADIAFAPVWKLSRWIESKQLTSVRLTEIYLKRIARLDSRLRCVITLTAELARRQAKRADEEIARGHYRGPLHGIAWGGKDLLDTAGIPTTYGAEPYRDRVPKVDAAVVHRLHEAGAVLVAKLSLGALALNDVWFGGQTMNPWLLEEGASGSSAGPGAATAAGLVAFAIGSETEGSIVGPTMRCGLTGLRPTFGRVPRTGAMTLSWSLDKLGPMARSVEDTMLVLQAISGPDAGDLASAPHPLSFDANESIAGLRVGYFPQWMKEEPATELDRQGLVRLRELGLKPVEVALPDWPYGSLNAILFAESAAAFEELTLSRKADQLRMQVPDAWPNSFRQSRFVSAVDFVQADRLRRAVAQQMQKLFSQVDILLVPSLRDEMLTIGNFTGHPSLTLRAGFINVSEARSDWAPDPAHPLPRFDPPRRVPHGVTLVGRLFEEGTIARVALALEEAFKVADQRPPEFQGSA
ncbi:MAG TPA: amidase family protein [Steroidobacteraceae bacterium]|nr:amidase family protein [Steroidobacteraceae bacterium]